MRKSIKQINRSNNKAPLSWRKSYLTRTNCSAWSSACNHDDHDAFDVEDEKGNDCYEVNEGEEEEDLGDEDEEKRVRLSNENNGDDDEENLYKSKYNY